MRKINSFLIILAINIFIIFIIFSDYKVISTILTYLTLGSLYRLRIFNSKKYLESMLAIYAHELKNPIAASLLHLQIFKRTGNQAHVDNACNQIQRASSDLDTFLNFSRIKLDLLKVSDTSVMDVAHLTREASLSFPGVTYEGPYTLFKSTSPMLRNVIVNLLSNAVKYGGKSGIKVVLEDSANTWGITVSDKGPGIKKEKLNLIFEKFNTESISKGCGLGLYVAKHIVTQLGGKISCESDIGNGSKFMIKF